MSKIVYKPHCEKCGALIEQEVRFKRIMIDSFNHFPHLYATERYEFYPDRCENCGTIFDSAEVRLPEEEKEECFRNVGSEE
jgi:predicted Zn-ribbon and HTH transcriptional regulator